MNALIAFRSNRTGVYDVPRAKRDAAAQEISANSRTKATAEVRVKSGVATKAESSATTTDSSIRTVDNALGRDAFLQLLVLEMQNQDPTNPVNNEDMIAQLAQFSSLEQMENLNDKFDLFADSFRQSTFVSAGALLGRTVTGLDTEGTLRTGIVEGLTLQNGTIFLKIDGKQIPMGWVQQVELASGEAETGEAAADTTQAKAGSLLSKLFTKQED